MKSVAIIGGGSASFITADLLSKEYHVTIYEKGKTIGRKFLVAGKGGFNLAHNLPSEKLISKYSPIDFLDTALEEFGVKELQEWYLEIGVPTFIGTSNRVFPEKGISPATVLQKIKNKLLSQNVSIQTNHEFVGFTGSNTPIISVNQEKIELDADIIIFALGGGSWKVTGSNPNWHSHFQKIGIKTSPFQSSNCGLNLNWTTHIKEFHLGKPLKNIAVSHGNITIKGEAVITTYGIEGNAIYPISAMVRDAINGLQNPNIFIDLLPQLSVEQILSKIQSTKPSNYAKLLKLDSAKQALLKSYVSKENYLDSQQFAKQVKSMTLPIESLRPMEESISTVGGIPTSELNSDFSLNKFPNMFCIGEMVDWDAPTGGFLLQGCFSMGHHVASQVLGHKKAD